MSSYPRSLFLPLALFVSLSGLLFGCGDGSQGPTAPMSVGELSLRGLEGDATIPAAGPVTRICVLLDDDGSADLDAVAQTHGLTVLRRYGNDELGLVEGVIDPVALEQDARIKAFQSNGFTVLSNPVELTMGFYEGFWEEDLPTQDALSALHLTSVHARLRGRGVKVAVLDTGVDPSHPWLSSRLELLPEDNVSSGSQERAAGVDSDGDGIVDEAYGHGTHVAGIIATIAPEATILPVRVLDSDGVGSAFELAVGIFEAAEHDVDIMNLSLVLEGEADVVEAALRRVGDQGILVIGAAGNEPGEARFPASDSHVLGVAAVDAASALAPFSADEGARLGAPGVSLLSAYPGEASSVASGTSMACAVVSGAAALLTEVFDRGEAAGHLLRITARSIPGSEISDGEMRLVLAVKSLERGPRVAPRAQPSP